MRIHCPLNPELLERLDELVSLGADEFFFGYANRLSDSLSMMSLRQVPHSSFPSLGNAMAAISKIKKLGASAFITVNGMFYTDYYLDAIVPEIVELSAGGCDGFIVTDINLFLRLKEANPGLYLIASSGAHVMNSRVVKFLQSLGARRCILPRQVAPSEIRAVVAASAGMDFEIFMKNEECAFLDGYCSYSHHSTLDDRPACNELYKMNSPLAAGRLGKWGSCGACILYILRDIRNLSLKICGRSLGFDLIHKDVAFVKRIIDALAAATDAVDYAGLCREFHNEIYGSPCEERCYFGIRAAEEPVRF